MGRRHNAAAMALQEPIPGAIRITTDAGVMWYPEDCEVLTPALAAAGSWEPGLLARLQRHVRPGMTALVAGAHVGYFVRHLSSLVGVGGLVVAVEPAPDNFRLLQANVADASNVKIIHAAGWASSGTLELSLSPSNTGDHRAVGGRDESRVRVRVPALALDDVFADAERLDVAVLGARASEPHLLRGLYETLRRFVPRLFVELWPAGLREAGHDPTRMIQMLTELGYRLQLLEGGPPDLIAAAVACPGGYATIEARGPRRRRRPLPQRYVPYAERRNEALTTALGDPAVTGTMRDGGSLPEAYGAGLDERIIELPWACSQLTPGGWLDAGSTFNSRPALAAALSEVDRVTVVTTGPEPESFTSMGVSYVYADLRELPFRDDWFDGVACISTLEHVGMDNRIYGDPRPSASDPAADAAAALAELRRVLRPGGRLLLSLPFGRAENFGWFRQFDDRMLAELVGEQVTIAVFRYFGAGWRRSTIREAADATYRDAGREPDPEDGAVAARAVACVRCDC
jgi:FkbM family methyltransferase